MVLFVAIVWYVWYIYMSKFCIMPLLISLPRCNRNIRKITLIKSWGVLLLMWQHLVAFWGNDSVVCGVNISLLLYILYYLLCFAKFYFPIDVIIKYLIALVILQTWHCWVDLPDLSWMLMLKQVAVGGSVTGMRTGFSRQCPLLAGCIST